MLAKTYVVHQVRDTNHFRYLGQCALRVQDAGTLVLLHVGYAGGMSTSLRHKQHNESPGLHCVLAIVQEVSGEEDKERSHSRFKVHVLFALT